VSNLLSSAGKLISGGKAAYEKFPGIKSLPSAENGETNEWVSLGKMATNIAINAAGITQAVRTVYCAGVALTNPMMLLDTVGLMAKGAGAIALDMAERMVTLVKNQITQALSQINGVFGTLTQNALGYIEGLRGFLGSVKSLLDTFNNFVDNLKINANLEYEEFCSKEDCEFMFAMMGACLLSKLLGNKLQEFEQKVSNKIINAGSDLNSAIADGLSSVSNISGFLEREKFMMEKASKQLDGIHRTIEAGANSKSMGPLSVNTTVEATTNTSPETAKKSKAINQAAAKLKESKNKKLQDDSAKQENK
jgi:hypothetical protein